MDMSAAWMRETAEAMEAAGWQVSHGRKDEGDFVRDRYEVRGGEREQLVFECLTYPDGDERYWLQLVAWHGLRTYPFPLDSWKFRDAFVEFKFHVEPVSGLGLSFIVDFPRKAYPGDGLSPPSPS